LASDVGADETNLAGGSESISTEHALLDRKPIGVERTPIGVGQRRAGKTDLAAAVSAE
jgi:hypothetical protein